MKNHTLWSIITFVAIGAVAAFGVVSLIMNPKIIVPNSFQVESANLHLKIDATAEWTDPHDNFHTETNSDGIIDDEWDMPNIAFSAQLKSATLTIKIENLSNSQAAINFIGIAYDREISSIANYRFTTTVAEYHNTSIIPANTQDINSALTTYRTTIASGESATFKITYELKSESASISEITQTITLSCSVAS